MKKGMSKLIFSMLHLLFFSFVLLTCGNDSDYRSSIKKSDSTDELSGGYCGVVMEESEFGEGYFVEEYYCYYFLLTNNQLKIYSFGRLYECSLNDSIATWTDIFGNNYSLKFTKRNGLLGIEQLGAAGKKYFLEKKYPKEAAQDKVIEYYDWEIFYKDFLLAFQEKNKKSLIETINVPFEDRRRLSWDDPEIINDAKGIEKLAIEILNSRMYENDYFVYYGIETKEADPMFFECYRIDFDTMFLYFKRVNGKFKLVTATNTFG